MQKNRSSAFKLSLLSCMIYAAAHCRPGLAQTRPPVPNIPKEVDKGRQEKIWAAAPTKPLATPKKKRRLLIFDTPAPLMKNDPHAGYCVPFGNYALQVLGLSSGAYEPVPSDDIAMFLPENLAKFDAVFFNNTAAAWTVPSDEAMETLGKYGDKEAVEKLIRNSIMDYIEQGGGVVGLHFAIAGNSHWPEWRWLWGGTFTGHPWGECTVKLDDPTHPLLSVFEGKNFKIKEEIYLYGDPYSREYLRVLMSIDVPNTDMSCPWLKRRDDDDYALAWVRKVGKGRLFYAVFGHMFDIYCDTRIMQMYLNGIQFAMGDLDVPTEPSAWNMAPGKFDLAAVKQRYTQAQGLHKAAILRAVPAYAGAEAIPMFTEALKDQDPQVRLAAFWGLGLLGNASVLPALAEASAGAEQQEKDAARTALVRMKASDVEPAMLAMAADSAQKNSVRVELIHALKDRRAAGAEAVLLKTAQDKDKSVRIASLSALGRTAEAKTVPQLLALVQSASDDEERLAAAEALAATVTRAGAPEKELSLLASACDSAQPPQRKALLRALSRIGGAKALAPIRNALKDKDAAVASAAVHAMAEWPDPAPLEELKSLATDAASDADKAAALAGHIRLIALKTDLAPAEKVKLYEAAMELADQDAHKTMIYEGLAKTPDARTLEFLFQHIEELKAFNEEKLLPQAEKAYVDAGILLMKTQPKQAKEALLKFCGISENKELVERAGKAME